LTGFDGGLSAARGPVELDFVNEFAIYGWEPGRVKPGVKKP
jgi:hypothetical protein